MRTDSLWLFGVIRISQALSLVLVIGAIVWVWMQRKNHPQRPTYVSVDNPKSSDLWI